jgi:hypothetical protein
MVAAGQRLIRDSCELIKAIPPVSDEEGAKAWVSEPVFALCVGVGELMSSAGRPRDAVNFIQSVKVMPSPLARESGARRIVL